MIPDHVGVIAHDLRQAADCYERMGFRLGASARHRRPVPPGMAVETWGAANRCAIFPRGYLELAGIVDADRFLNGFDEMLAAYEGCRIVALKVADPAAAGRALRDEGPRAQRHPVRAPRPGAGRPARSGRRSGV